MTKDDVKLNWLAVAESGSIAAVHNLREHYAALEAELEQEKKLNAEIKARFVKCNTCTPDMKEKCLMFNENLCEGERCEELVDLMSLVDKRDSDDKLTKAVEIIKKLMVFAEIDLREYTPEYQEAEQFLKEIEE